MEEGSQKAEHLYTADAQGAVAQSHIPGRPGEGTGLRSSTAQRKLLVPSVSQGFEEENHFTTHQKHAGRASLVAQWLRICLPMQGTRVRALVWEDPTCRGANGPVSHNC